MMVKQVVQRTIKAVQTAILGCQVRFVLPSAARSHHHHAQRMKPDG